MPFGTGSFILIEPGTHHYGMASDESLNPVARHRAPRDQLRESRRGPQGRKVEFVNHEKLEEGSQFPEFIAADDHGNLFVNLKDKGAIVVLDAANRKVKATWPMKGAKSLPDWPSIDAVTSYSPPPQTSI